jgi:transposase
VEVLAELEQATLPETDKPKGQKGRKPLSDKLPRHQVFAYLTEEEKVDAIDTFFVKVREELDIIPEKSAYLNTCRKKPPSNSRRWPHYQSRPANQASCSQSHGQC